MYSRAASNGFDPRWQVRAGRAIEPSLDIVAIGASAGGLEAVCELLKEVPRGLPATVLVVIHRPTARISHLPEILARETHLHVVTPHGGEPMHHGDCLIGPPDRHLTIGPDLRVQLLSDSFYRGHNIDALFSSLALHAGRRTIGVVLSGLLKDGTLGLRAIKEAGGIALVQSPQSAQYSDMPRSAIVHDGPVDLVGPPHALAVAIGRLVGHPHPPAA